MGFAKLRFLVCVFEISVLKDWSYDSVLKLLAKDELGKPRIFQNLILLLKTKLEAGLNFDIRLCLHAQI